MRSDTALIARALIKSLSYRPPLVAFTSLLWNSFNWNTRTLIIHLISPIREREIKREIKKRNRQARMAELADAMEQKLHLRRSSKCEDSPSSSDEEGAGDAGDADVAATLTNDFGVNFECVCIDCYYNDTKLIPPGIVAGFYHRMISRSIDCDNHLLRFITFHFVINLVSISSINSLHTSFRLWFSSIFTRLNLPRIHFIQFYVCEFD